MSTPNDMNYSRVIRSCTYTGMGMFFVFVSALVFLFSCSSSRSAAVAETNGNTIAELSEAVQAPDTALADAAAPDFKELDALYAKVADAVSNYYVLAQQYFFAGYFNEALYFINQAAQFDESADIYALKGSIYLGLGNRKEFIANWKKAFEMDKELPLPISPFVLENLKAEGLIPR